jgi:ubiquinone/menaquinone biosynthesis C-methylase UbiE
MIANEAVPSFSGSIPEIYDKYLVPLVFEPYAIDLAQRVADLPLTNVLELAAGTGVLTRRLARALPGSVFIIATDLQQPMLDLAASVGTSRPVEWRQADALELPYDKASFDAVVCQFGVMFFPDRARAFAEVRRVLRRGGVFIFNVWDRIEDNEFALLVTESLAGLFPAEPPRFLARVPHGYHDIAMIRRDLAAAGFQAVAQVTTLAARSRAASAHIPAVAFCQGTPLRNEIEAQDGEKLATATSVAEAAIAAKFGSAAVDGKMQAHVVQIEG